MKFVTTYARLDMSSPRREASVLIVLSAVADLQMPTMSPSAIGNASPDSSITQRQIHATKLNLLNLNKLHIVYGRHLPVRIINTGQFQDVKIAPMRKHHTVPC